MPFTKLPPIGTPLRLIEELDVWVVTAHDMGVCPIVACLTKDEDAGNESDSSTARLTLDELSESFEPALNPGMFHEIMDRASLVANLWEREIVNTLAVTYEPALNVAAGNIMKSLLAFYQLSGEVFWAWEEEDANKE